MFKCDLCDKSFKFKSKLEEHKNNKNPCNKPKKSTRCELCSIEFPCLAKLERHKKSKSHNIIEKQYITEEPQTINNITNIYNTNIELNLKEEIELLKKDKELLKKDKEILKNKNDILENTIKENEIVKYKRNEEVNLNIEDNDILILKPLFNEITNSKSIKNINLELVVNNYYQLLSIQDLLFIVNYDINNLYIDKFWNSIEDDKWIYLDNELIEWFGYKEISKGKELILRLLKNFEINEDYKIYNNADLPEESCSPPGGEQDSNSHGGNNKKHIIINPDCFKEICMLINTIKSKEVRSYFLEIEKIFKLYNKYILKYNQIKLEKTILIKNTYINRNILKFNEWVYLISNQAKARENIFKFGFTSNKQTRLSPYNTGSVKGDRFFYCELYECYDGKTLEARLSKLLINFKIPNESEMYQLNFKALDMIIKNLCKNDNKSVDTINEFLASDYDKYLNLEPVKFDF